MSFSVASKLRLPIKISGYCQLFDWFCTGLYYCQTCSCFLTGFYSSTDSDFSDSDSDSDLSDSDDEDSSFTDDFLDQDLEDSEDELLDSDSLDSDSDSLDSTFLDFFLSSTFFFSWTFFFGFSDSEESTSSEEDFDSSSEELEDSSSLLTSSMTLLTFLNSLVATLGVSLTFSTLTFLEDFSTVSFGALFFSKTGSSFLDFSFFDSTKGTSSFSFLGSFSFLSFLDSFFSGTYLVSDFLESFLDLSIFLVLTSCSLSEELLERHSYKPSSLCLAMFIKKLINLKLINLIKIKGYQISGCLDVLVKSA